MKSSKHTTSGTVGGRRKQSGIPTFHGMGPGARRANGLMVRGVVTATYVQLDEGENPYPNAPRAGVSTPLVENITAVYCDVLTYGALANTRNTKLHRVLVSQARSGMHEGDIWKPRAARLDISAPALDDRVAQPYDLDGDHVLIGFLEDNLDLPIIVRALPHPRAGYSNENLAEAGHRQRLKLVDGEPDFRKHRGTFYGVDDNGDFVIDTTRAHDGNYASDGSEVPAGDSGHGSVRVRVAADNTVHIQIGGGETLLVVDKDGNASLTLGDGAVHAAIFEHVQSWWDDVAFPAIQALFDAHVHPSGMGPTGPTPTPLAAIAEVVAMLLSAKSTKLTFPDG